MTARDPIADLNERIKRKAAMNDAAQQEKVSATRSSTPGVVPAAAAPSKYHDEADHITWLVETYFNSSPLACEKCPYFLELSETCENLENGEAELCPRLDFLIEENVREMRDEHEAGVP